MSGNISKNVLIGGLIVIAGITYLLSNLGLLPGAWSHIIISWQMLLILLGIGGFIQHKYVGGLILMIIGTVFIMPKLAAAIGFYYSVETLHSVIWPLAVIAVGLLIMFRRHNHIRNQNNNFMHSQTQSKDGKIDYNLTMNGVDEVFLEPIFRGGEINTIMGGAKLDLRRTSLPEGETVLKISSIFGGVTLLIPLDWNVVIKSDSILGGFADHRHENGTRSDRTLVIDASFIFGGGSIE